MYWALTLFLLIRDQRQIGCETYCSTRVSIDLHMGSNFNSRHVRKIAKSVVRFVMSIRLSICPSVCPHRYYSTPTRRVFMKFYVYFSKIF